MDYITMERDGQEVRIPVEEVMLEDGKFCWRERKEKTMRLYELYEKAGFPEYAARTRDCATWLQFNVYKNGDRKLRSANFCKLRLCPMCISRRARRSAWKLSQVLNLVEVEHEGTLFLFLTLTIKSVPGPELGHAIAELTEAWDRFRKQRQIERTIKGWFRAIEITRTGKGYHPHIHAILAVEPDYFSRESRKSGKYLNQSELIDRWQRALRVDYRPSVRIQTTKAKAGKGEALKSAGGAAAAEAAKYAVKDEEYIDPKLPDDLAVEILRDYTVALHRRRLMAFGGWLKDAARALDAEDLENGDLVRVEEEELRSDLVELVEDFRWRFGAGDFILASREIPVDLKTGTGE